MKPMAQSLSRVTMVLVGVLTGAISIGFFVANRQVPERVEVTEMPTPVRVIEATPLDFQLETRGYGVARPTQTWRAVANIPGRVVFRHPELESGAFLPRNTLLMALDPSRHKLAIAETETELNNLSKELNKLDIEEKNTRRLLALEQQRLELAERELARIEALVTSGSASPSRHDNQLQATLAQRKTVASLENALGLIPAMRDISKGKLEQVSLSLARARLDLEDTRFVAPYDLRLDAVNVDMHQQVIAGQQVFQADSVAAIDVEAQVHIASMRRLLGRLANEESPPVLSKVGIEPNYSSIHANIELVGFEQLSWMGRLTQVAHGLNPTTQTAKIVVRVQDPYAGTRNPYNPSLQPDMYVRIRLSKPSSKPLLAVPASALHQNELYLVDADGRLDRRPVRVAFIQNDLAVIEAGLETGDQVLVDDLALAVQGMPLSPRRDAELENQIEATASGRRP